MEKVKIDEFGIFKYILAEVSDDQNIWTVVRGGLKYDLHKKIFSSLLREVYPSQIKCLGGGQIAVFPEQKKACWGFSSAFGAADHEAVIKIIKNSIYSAYSVIIDDRL